MKKVRFVGLDVHADTIAVAVAEPGGTVRSVGVIPNRPESIRRLVKQLGSPEQLHTCYEAGPHGVCRLLAADRTRRAVRGGRAHLGADESRRSREDGSARCLEAGAQLPRGRLDAGVGPRRRARGAARRGARPRGGEERPAARAPSLGKVSAATRAVPAHRYAPLDPAASPVGQGRTVCLRGARGDVPGLSPRGRAYGRTPGAARGRA